jgi:hypothetical protein
MCRRILVPFEQPWRSPYEMGMVGSEQPANLDNLVFVYLRLCICPLTKKHDIALRPDGPCLSLLPHSTNILYT